MPPNREPLGGGLLEPYFVAVQTPNLSALRVLLQTAQALTAQAQNGVDEYLSLSCSVAGLPGARPGCHPNVLDKSS